TCLFFTLSWRPRTSTLFPYTTLFRSVFLVAVLVIRATSSSTVAMSSSRVRRLAPAIHSSFVWWRVEFSGRKFTEYCQAVLPVGPHGLCSNPVFQRRQPVEPTHAGIA